MISSPAVQVIAVTSGKGGVGKSCVSVNLSLALAARGQRVVLFDANLGMTGINVSLGVNAEHSILDVIEGRCGLRDVMIKGPGGIHIIPAAEGSREMAQLSTAQYGGLIQAFSDIDDDLDVLVIDTAPGIGDQVVNFVRAAQEVLIVVCNDPTSIASAYSLIRTLNRDYGIIRFRVVANMMRVEHEGRSLFARLSEITNDILEICLQYAGAIPYDDYVTMALKKHRAVVAGYPHSKATKAFHALAVQAQQWPLQMYPQGHMQFFIERLVRQSVDNASKS